MSRTSAAMIALMFLAAGCQRGDVQLGKVSGTITMEGSPLSGALVTFIPEGGGRSSTGRTDEQGRYELAYSIHDVGATIGKSKVMITTGNMEDAQHRNETVAFEYNFESTLVADIKAGQNQFDYDVKPREVQNSRR